MVLGPYFPAYNRKVSGLALKGFNSAFNDSAYHYFKKKKNPKLGEGESLTY